MITKSGGTFETMAQFLLALEWLGPKEGRRRTHVVAITDPQKGDLKAYAAHEDLPTLHIAPSIGGRFSIFTPVGLFPAALAGLNVKEFLQGAKQVRDYIEKTPLEKNPALHFGRRSDPPGVEAPDPRLHAVLDTAQAMGSLVRAALGRKPGQGWQGLHAARRRRRDRPAQHPPASARRAGRQGHVLPGLDQVEDEVRIPKLGADPIKQAKIAMLPSFKLLEAHTLHELLKVENRATSLVLSKQGRPNLMITLDRLDERALGALTFAFSFLTALTGTLWGVNPFDQPGVEEGKVYIRDSLSHQAQLGRTEQRASPRTSTDDDSDENSPVNRLRRGRGDEN